MIDHLRLRIPVNVMWVKTYGDNLYHFSEDLLDTGLLCAGRSVKRRDDGSLSVHDLYTPYEQLGTDYSGMAVKFFHQSHNCLPGLEIKASPAKLLQGHNVFGSDCLRLGASHMLALVCHAYPTLCQYLNFKAVEVMHIDVTYFARLPHQNLVQPVIDFLSQVQVKHRKANHVKYSNYLTFNSASNRYLSAKIYGKFLEVQAQIDKHQKRANKGCQTSKKLIEAMNRVLEFSKACLRFEARIHKTYLVKNGYPTNLYELIDYQNQHPKLMPTLWGATFNDILNTLKGSDIMLKNHDDDTIREVCLKHLTTYGIDGKRYESQAKNAFLFYCALREHGFVKTKKLYSESSFYKNLNNLMTCGFSRSFLQNLHKDQAKKVIPFVRMIEINFNEQLPPDFVEPTSGFDLSNTKIA